MQELSGSNDIPTFQLSVKKVHFLYIHLFIIICFFHGAPTGWISLIAAVFVISGII